MEDDSRKIESTCLIETEVLRSDIQSHHVQDLSDSEIVLYSVQRSVTAVRLMWSILSVRSKSLEFVNTHQRCYPAEAKFH